MPNSTRAFDISTARQGQTLKHKESGNAYIVFDATPRVAVIRNTHGQKAFVGPGLISPDDFEEIVFPPFI